MEKKLYLVTVTPEPFEMCVMADSEPIARGIALKHAHQEYLNIEPSYFASGPREIRLLSLIPEEFHHSIPYGSTDDKTVAEILGSKGG